MDVHEAWDWYLSAALREYKQSCARASALYPHYSTGGKWELLDVGVQSISEADEYAHGNWTAGFWFGTMWLATLGTGDDGPAALANQRLEALSERRFDHTTHDLGFLFYPSTVFGVRHRLAQDRSEEWAMDAARMTARRLNAAGGYIQAFGPVGHHRWGGTSTIDTMMNLPLLWWAWDEKKEPAVYEAARQHARTSARVFLRPDGSSAHLLKFDPLTGALVEETTFQGAGAQSSWSRGQAWAVCGFAWSYAATGEQEQLTAAERAAEYFWTHLPRMRLPPWDFAEERADGPRDASAAAVAALGALILGRTHPDPGQRDTFSRQGHELLANVCEQALNRDPETEGILLYSCYSRPHQRGLDGATAWGDFFVGLALALATNRVSLDGALGFTSETKSVQNC